MRTIWNMAFYELKNYLQLKSVLVSLMVAPLFLIFILGSALSNAFQENDKEIQPLNVYVNDADQEQLSGIFKYYTQIKQINQLMKIHYVDSKETVELKVKSLEADFGLIIPQGFSAALFTDQPTEWTYLLGSDLQKNTMAELILTSFLEELRRIQATVHVIGPQILEDVRFNLSSPVFITDYVQEGKLTKEGNQISAIQYYASSMLVMFVLYAGLSAAMSLLSEKEKHTLLRLESLPISSTQIVIGKLLGSTILGMIQAALILLFTYYVYDVDWGSSISGVLLISILTISASIGLGFLVSFLLPSTKLVSGGFSTFIAIMTFISGGMAPHLGGIFDTLKLFTINNWAHQGLIHLMLGQQLSYIMNNILILGLVSTTLILAAIGFYRKVGYHE